MKYPCLVPKRLCKVPIHLEIEPEGLSKYGEPLDTIIYDGKCNYQDKARTILTTDKSWWRSLDQHCSPGDIRPELPVISGGTAAIFGVKRRIQQGTKSQESGRICKLYGGAADLIKVNSKVRLNMAKIRQLTSAQATAPGTDSGGIA